MGDTQGLEQLTLEQLMKSDISRSTKEIYINLTEEAKTLDFGPFNDEICIYDTETTGLNFNDDELIEIAAAIVRKGEVVDQFDTFVKPSKPITEEITQITNITNGDVVDAPQAYDAVKQFKEFVEKRPLVAHNANFDKNFITKVRGVNKVTRTWWDSLALSRIALPLLTNHKLSDMADAFGCHGVTHRAIDDVMALAAMWPIILAALTHLSPELLQTFATMHPEVEWPYRELFSWLSEHTSDVQFGDFDAGDLDTPDKYEMLSYERFKEVLGTNQFSAPQKEFKTALTTLFHDGVNGAIETGFFIDRKPVELDAAFKFADANQIRAGIAISDKKRKGEMCELIDQLGYQSSIFYLRRPEEYPCLEKVHVALTTPLPEPPEGCTKSLHSAQREMLDMLAALLSYEQQAPVISFNGLGMSHSVIPSNLFAKSLDEIAADAQGQDATQDELYANCPLKLAMKEAQRASVVLLDESFLYNVMKKQHDLQKETYLPCIEYWIVDDAHNAPDVARMQWATPLPLKAPKAFPELSPDPLHLEPLFKSYMYDATKSFVYCSSATALGDDFSFFNREVGFTSLSDESYKNITIKHEQDLESRIKIAYIQDATSPSPMSNAPRYLNDLTAVLTKVIPASQGGVFTLFRSRKDMEAVVETLGSTIERAGLSLRCQTQKCNRANLADYFTQDAKTSLFAFAPFWNSFDLSGEPLRCFVLTKLPYEPLGSSLNTAWINELGRDAFFRDYYNPRTALNLKGLLSRLLAGEDDRVILLITDSRFGDINKQFFMQALPHEQYSSVRMGYIDEYLNACSDFLKH